MEKEIIIILPIMMELKNILVVAKNKGLLIKKQKRATQFSSKLVCKITITIR